MGNGPNNQSSRSQQSHTYITDNHYGGKVIYKQLTNTIYQQMSLEKRHLQPILQLLEERKKINNPNILTVQSYFTKTEELHSNFSCTSDHKVSLFIQYNYLTKTLENLIEEYSRKQIQIPEKVIRRFFYIIIDALNELKKHKTCHGDIKPSNILLDDAGQLKLVDSYLINGGKTSYEIVMENPSSMSLLSPEQLERIKNRQFEEIKTIHQSQIFSVGLTLIEAMTFQPAMEAYDLIKLSIKPEFIHRKLQELKATGYSKELIEMIISCISLKADLRPTFQQLLNRLKPK